MINAKDLVVFDFETTGFSPTKDDPTQLAYVVLERNTLNVLDKGNIYFKTDKKISKEITELTGIDNKLLEEKGVDAEDVLDIIETVFHDKIAVGHNVKFDLSFLSFHFGIVPRFFLDTCLIGKIEAPQLENHKLGTLVNFANIELSNAHNALYDTIATADLLKFYQKNGVDLESYINISTKSDYKKLNG